jgi:predicted short-subunit dehydrogenase-like oxidoreductase (DUF2520 family)
MRITLIGAGNLATRLGIALHESGFRITQVYSRTAEAAQTLADRLGAQSCCRAEEADTTADLCIFAVKDSALPDLLPRLKSGNGVWVHTAGSVPMDIFAPYSARYGVIYPLQTLSKNREADFTQVPVYTEGSDESVKTLLHEVATKITTQVLEATSDQRKHLHLAAVFACNFTNRMYAIAASLLESKGLDFAQLLPLIDETTAKIHKLHPREAQTGPAIRYDENVISRHIYLLADSELKEIYSLMSRNIHHAYQE